MLAARLAILALLVACPAPRAPRTTASEPLTPAAGAGEPLTPADAADVRAATFFRLAGDPDRAIAKLRPLAARLPAAGLAELSRALAASQHAAEARAALEEAVARAERDARSAHHGGRGRWRWQQGTYARIVRTAFTPDGARLVSADTEGWIRIWDIAGGHEQRTIKARGWPNSLDISPDGRWIAAAGGNGPVEVWDAATGARILEIPEDGPAQFTPEGRLVVASRKQDGLIELELPSGQAVGKIGTGWPRSLAITRDRIYAADEDTQRQPIVVVWERGGAGRKLEERAMPAPIWGLAAAPRGELVVVLPGKVLIHDAAGKLRHTLEDVGAAVALTPDGGRLLGGDGEGGVKLFDLASGRLIRRFEVGGGWVAIAAHPRAALLATAGAGGLATWSLGAGERTSRFGSPAAARAVAFDEAGRRLAVGTAAGAAAIWDLDTGQVREVTPRAAAPVTAVAFGPGGVLATASGPQDPRLTAGTRARPSPRGMVAVWERSGARRWAKDLDELSWIGFRPGTDVLATASMVPGAAGAGSAAAGVTLWDAGGGRLSTLAAGARGAFAWSPDGARLAHAGEEHLALAPAGGGPGPAIGVTAELAAFDPRGGPLAVAGEGGLISLWDPATRQPQRVLLDDAKVATALAWSPAGSVLATAAGDAVRLWDPRTGARLATLTARGTVTAIAFRPDGHVLAVACDDGLVELWSIADASLVATLAAPGEGRGLVLAPDGAADGALSDEDPLFWAIGDAVLPARAAWARAATPGLLASRLAAVPAGTAPRAGLAGAAPAPAPPACFTGPGDDEQPVLVSASAPDARSLSLCVAVESYGDAPARLPACFVLDIAAGAFRPRAPTAHEALRRDEPGDTTIQRDGTRVTVCHAGACRGVTIPELATRDPDDPTGPGLAISDSRRLVAAITKQGDLDAEAPARAVVYDLASGRRIRRLDLGGAFASLDFLGETLLVTTTPCAGPCSSSRLVDPRTGRKLGALGGTQALNTSELTAARVTGDVWAFNDWGSPAIVYQDVRTGRVVRRFDRPTSCAEDGSGACDVRLLAAGGGLAIVGEGDELGQITLADVRGKIVAQHRVPPCRP